MTITVDAKKTRIDFTPLGISKPGGGEVFSGQSTGLKEAEPLGSPITIEHVSGESNVSPDVFPFIKNRPEQISIPPELKGIVKQNESISFPDRQQIVLPLTDEKTSEWSKGNPEESKTWLGTLSDKIKKALYFKKVQTA